MQIFGQLSQCFGWRLLVRSRKLGRVLLAIAVEARDDVTNERHAEEHSSGPRRGEEAKQAGARCE